MSIIEQGRINPETMQPYDSLKTSQLVGNNFIQTGGGMPKVQSLETAFGVQSYEKTIGLEPHLDPLPTSCHMNTPTLLGIPVKPNQMKEELTLCWHFNGTSLEQRLTTKQIDIEKLFNLNHNDRFVVKDVIPKNGSNTLCGKVGIISSDSPVLHKSKLLMEDNKFMDVFMAIPPKSSFIQFKKSSILKSEHIDLSEDQITNVLKIPELAELASHYEIFYRKSTGLIHEACPTSGRQYIEILTELANQIDDSVIDNLKDNSYIIKNARGGRIGDTNMYLSFAPDIDNPFNRFLIAYPTEGINTPPKLFDQILSGKPSTEHTLIEQNNYIKMLEMIKNIKNHSHGSVKTLDFNLNLYGKDSIEPQMVGYMGQRKNEYAANVVLLTICVIIERLP